MLDHVDRCEYNTLHTIQCNKAVKECNKRQKNSIQYNAINTRTNDAVVLDHATGVKTIQYKTYHTNTYHTTTIQYTHALRIHVRSRRSGRCRRGQ